MYYLDSNFLIDYLRNNSSNLIEDLRLISPKEIKVPSIVKAELMAGAYKKKNVEQAIRDVEKITSFFEVVSFDDDAAKVYGKIRAELESKGRTIGSNDLLIAALVLSRGGILITDNTKEFCHIEGLRLENWNK